jgi:hypothetical protein
VVCVRSVLDPAEVAVAAAAIDAVLARPGPLAQVASGRDDPGAFTEDFCRWQEVPGIERLARSAFDIRRFTLAPGGIYRV